MKASVITLHTVNNYGSAMQTYATQKTLEKLGFDVEVVDYCRSVNMPEALAAELLKSSTMQKLKPLWGISKKTEALTVFLIKRLYLHRETNTWRFILDNVALTDRRFYSLEELKANPPIADVYVTGSDQVWNSTWNQGIDEAYFLEYAPLGKPRIAFAASIGRTEFDDAEKDTIRELLEKYSAISVREQSAVSLLRSIGISAELTPDPTVMLDSEAWRKMEDTSFVPKFPYLLIYQLHPNPRMDGYAVELARRKGWRIVRIGFGRSDFRRPGKCVRGASVERFLGLLGHAACILTDSFHATAFALNLGVDYIGVLPQQFGTRIESIAEITGTTNRLLKSYDDYGIADIAIDKENVQRTLNEFRAQGYAFLRKALSI